MDVYWLEQTEGHVPTDNRWLSAGEVAWLNRLRFPKRRADWRLGRWTAKRALSAYLDGSGDSPAFEDLEIRQATSGAPRVFLADQPLPLRISLSHRDGTALCAVAASNAALGCDLELIEPRSDAFATDYFTREEQQLVASAAAGERSFLLALLWSAKESALKALREGLRLDTRHVTVSLFAGPTSLPNKQPDVDGPVIGAPSHDLNWRRLQVRYADGQVFHGWWRRTGDLLRTLVAAPAPGLPLALKIPAHG